MGHASRIRFWAIFWVDVSIPSNAEADFLKIAKAIGCTVKGLDETLDLLANSDKNWLLVLDNADDIKVDYHIYFPSGTRGSIVMTSRNPDCSLYSTVGSEVLESLTDEESLQLLLKAARICSPLSPSKERTAKEILELLGSHTLALIQAGAYISTTSCTLAKYLENLRGVQRAPLLKYKRDQAQSRYGSVFDTFEISARILESSPQTTDASDALQILGVLSVLYHRDFSRNLFERAWTEYQHLEKRPNRKFRRDISSGDLKPDEISIKQTGAWLPEFVLGQDNKLDDCRLEDAITLLVSLALISVKDCYIHMHPLTHTWSKERQSFEQQAKAWNCAGSLIALSVNIDWLWLEHNEWLRPHVRRYLENGRDGLLRALPEHITATRSVFLHCIGCLSSLESHHQIEEDVIDWVIEDVGLSPTTPSLKWAWLYETKITLLDRGGKVREAQQLNEKIIELRTSQLNDAPTVSPYLQFKLAKACTVESSRKPYSYLNSSLKINRQGRHLEFMTPVNSS